MTDTQDVTRAFLSALPGHVRTQVHTTQLIDGMVHAAVRDHGWTIAQLAKECGRDIPHDHANPGQLVTYRLRHAAGNPPPHGQHGAAGKPFCSDTCRANAGWIVDPVSLLPVDRCPCRTPLEAATR